MKKLAAIGVLCVLGGLGCSSKTFGLRGLRCDEGACLDGFSCDTVTDTCVAVGDPCEEGRYLQCDASAVACENGCRLCDGGLWSDCQEIALGDCTPNVSFCEGRFLTVCDFTGNRVGTPEDCGVSGCNDTAGRCNDCPPDRTFCDGLEFVTCGSDGLEATREDCTTSNQCAGAGTCNGTTGCQVALSAPDGTPCDEGAGADGDFCNSSCVSGVCTVATATCDDGNVCTSDSCDTSSGCVFANDTGTPCPGSDSDSCTSTCDGFGGCTDGAPLDCDDTNPCTENNCSAGVCSNPAGNPGTECRAAVGDCDVAESCDGSSVTCPADGVATMAVSCRAPTGTGCDAEEFCDGVSKDCPADAVEGNTVSCRAPGIGEDCDAEEFCDGVSKDCPADEVLTGGVCRAAAPGGCDVEDVCNGVDKTCPDAVVAAGTECRAGGADVCDPPEQCNGIDPTCPAPSTLDDGTPCAFNCNVADLTTTTCDSGACTDNTACAMTMGCVGNVPTLNMAGPLVQPRRRTTGTVTLDIGCPGEASSISCTATSSSLCLLSERFGSGTGIFTGTNVSTVTCGDNGDIPTSSGDDACDKETMELGQDEIARLSSGFDITNFTSLRAFLKAGISDTTEGDGQFGDDDFRLLACCGANNSCLTTRVQIENSPDGGQDAWGDRPCPGGSCSGAGFDLSSPTVTGCNTSSNLFLGFQNQSNTSSERAEVDDFFLAGSGTMPVPVTGNGDGTYDVDVSACTAVDLTVDCTWDAGVAGMVSDSIVVSFGN